MSLQAWRVCWASWSAERDGWCGGMDSEYHNTCNREEISHQYFPSSSGASAHGEIVRGHHGKVEHL